MKKLFTSRFMLPAVFALVTPCATLLAQRRSEGHRENQRQPQVRAERNDRRNPGDFQPPVQHQPSETVRPPKRPPIRYDQPQPQQHQPPQGNPGNGVANNHHEQQEQIRRVDPDFRRSHPRPSHEYYNNAYRHHYSHPPVYSATNPAWRYRYIPARRTVITSFPFRYETIRFSGCDYRFYNGTFYKPYQSAFIVVAPPVGIFIRILPFGYQRIYCNSLPYYYFNGTYYQDYNSEYRVVAPPVGALVESLPQGYETLTIDGETYYKIDGVQYKPEVQDNGEIWYRVIKSE